MNDIDTDSEAILIALERPGTADILRRALAQHDEHGHEQYWSGFEWHDVRAYPATLKRLVHDVVIDVAYNSHKFTNYRLHNVEATREALERVGSDDRLPAPPIADEIPDDLFDVIEGQERVKDLLRLSVAAERPVHMLLEGPPATSKSMFLDELARLPNARYLLGGTTSRAGLVDFLLEARPRFVIIDELDKMSGDDMSALLSVMESGVVSRLKRNADQVARLWVWVFAGANRTSGIKPELLSRFWRKKLAPYTDDEFHRVAVAVLTKREGVDAEMANYIARQVLPRSRDPRDAVKVARLGKSKADIDLLVSEIQP